MKNKILFFSLLILGFFIHAFAAKAELAQTYRGIITKSNVSPYWVGAPVCGVRAYDQPFRLTDPNSIYLDMFFYIKGDQNNYLSLNTPGGLRVSFNSPGFFPVGANRGYYYSHVANLVNHGFDGLEYFYDPKVTDVQYGARTGIRLDYSYKDPVYQENDSYLPLFTADKDLNRFSNNSKIHLILPEFTLSLNQACYNESVNTQFNWSCEDQTEDCWRSACTEHVFNEIEVGNLSWTSGADFNCDALANKPAWEVSAFGECSKSCGDGTKVREVKCRGVNAELLEPALCDANSKPITNETCNLEACPAVPVDCAWAAWSPFSSCSALCGGGKQTQTRTIATPEANGGAACMGADINIQDCNTQPCSVDCTVSDWSAFGACSATACGTSGTQTQTRTIITAPANGGAACPSLTNSQACSAVVCPNCLKPTPIPLPIDTCAGIPDLVNTCFNMPHKTNAQKKLKEDCLDNFKSKIAEFKKSNDECKSAFKKNLHEVRNRNKRALIDYKHCLKQEIINTPSEDLIF